MCISSRMSSLARFSLSVLVLAGLAALAPPVRAEEFECLVEPYLKVSVSSAIPGILDAVQVDRGDRVTRGQVVALLQSDVERAHLDLLRARVAFAERKIARNEELYLKQMISIHEKDELETEMQLLKLEVREAEGQLARRSILSPIDGVVVKRHFSAGEFVYEDAILELAQIHPLRVEVAVPDRLYGAIKVGMNAAVQWEVPNVGTHTASVTVVDAVMDAASGTIGIRLELPNPRHRLPAGTQCRVTFPTD